MFYTFKAYEAQFLNPNFEMYISSEEEGIQRTLNEKVVFAYYYESFAAMKSIYPCLITDVPDWDNLKMQESFPFRKNDPYFKAIAHQVQ